MNILFIKHLFRGFMVSKIARVSVFRHFPYSVTFPYVSLTYIYIYMLCSVFCMSVCSNEFILDWRRGVVLRQDDCENECYLTYICNI